MLETDSEIQLKVWKDLAISKQILMRATIDALGLTSECTTEELQSALDLAIKRTKEADIKIAEMREQTEKELAAMKAVVKESEAALADGQEQVAEAIAARETLERQLASIKTENARALKAAKAEIAEYQRKVKATSKLLADTPENVVKKLKTLKKQKLDEARVRSQIEAKLRTTSKEKSDLEQEVEAQSKRIEETAPLLNKLREMHDFCMQANNDDNSPSADGKGPVEFPTLDEDALEILGNALSDQESDSGS